ncbi:MAG: hypothetical protein LBD75_07155 [Candidatus Peribacteria bacterium]|nr:hypothetical protein [Candidatus Peribacteria bacterium]
MKNFNNTLLLIGVGKELWTYGKMPDVNNPQGESIEGFTLIKEFEPGIEIVGISPGREYVKIFTVDEGFNSKIQYFQGSFDMADAGVINCVELSNQEIQRVYPLGTTDYYTNHIKTGNASIANAIQFKKVVGYEDYTILKMHA